jgi:formate--tetrahydrofolate ligase
MEHCRSLGVNAALSEVVARGGEGGIQLAEAVLKALEEENSFTHAYPLNISIREKIEMLGEKGLSCRWSCLYKQSQQEHKLPGRAGVWGPACLRSQDPDVLQRRSDTKGGTQGWTLNIRDVRVSAGAGFIVVLTGEMLTMPGLPKNPAAENIDILEDGTILGLF